MADENNGAERIDDFGPGVPTQTSGKYIPWPEHHALQYGDGTGRLVNGAKLLDAGIGFPDLKASNAAKANTSDLKEMAYIAAPPQGGRSYSLRWEGDTLQWAAAVSGSGMPIGTPCLLAQRREEFPDGWWFPSGDYFPLDSVVGTVLASFSATYKSDWGIVVKDDTIRLYEPNKFFSGNLGRFFRPANGTERLPGSIESDAMQNVTGRIQAGRFFHKGSLIASGPFYPDTSPSTTFGGAAGASSTDQAIGFDLSRATVTAAENRPHNVGLTPAVFLGV